MIIKIYNKLKGLKKSIILIFITIIIASLSSIELTWAETKGPSQDEILEDLNKANINWKQFEGKEIRVLLFTVAFQNELEKHIPIFEKLTGIKVNVEVYKMPQMREKRLIDLATKASIYDIWWFLPAHYGVQYYYAGWLEPLNEYLNDQKLTDLNWFKVEDIASGALGTGTFDEKLIYIPTKLSAAILFYRKDLLNKHNLKVPTTWQELYDTAKVISDKEKGIAGFVTRGEGYSAAWTWAYFYRSAGGPEGRWSWPTSYKEGGLIPTCLFDNDAGLRAVKFYSKILRDCGPKGIASYTWMESNRQFTDGAAAMLFEDGTFAPVFENPEKSKVAGKIGYSSNLSPGKEWGPGQNMPLIEPGGLAISSMSKNKNAAWLFLQFASSPIMSLKIGFTGMPMARNSVWSDSEIQKMFPHPDFYESQLEAFKLSMAPPYPMPRVHSAGEVRKEVGVAISKSIIGENPKEALKSSAREVERIINNTYKK